MGLTTLCGSLWATSSVQRQSVSTYADAVSAPGFVVEREIDGSSSSGSKGRLQLQS